MRHIHVRRGASLDHRRRQRFAGDRVRHRLRHFDFLAVHLHLDLVDGGGAGLGSVVAAVDIFKLSGLWAGRQFHFRDRSSALLGPAFLVRRAPGDEFILELGHEALHRPRTGLAKGADRASARDVVGNLDQVIGVNLAAFPMGEAMQGLGHPERAFAAGGALAAAFVRVKLRDVRQRLDDVSGIVQHDNRARTRHAAGGDERVEVIRQIEHLHLLLGLLAVQAPALELELLPGLEDLRRRAAGNDCLQLPPLPQAAAKSGIIDELPNGDFAHLNLVIARASARGR